MMNYLFIIDWDKVPNWIQAFGAIVAAIGLIYTLLLQQKTLKEQQKITKIEQINFLKGHLPLLELEEIIYIKQEQDRIINFDVAIRENYLQKLSIEHNFPESFKLVLPHVIPNVILSKNYKMSFKISFTLADVFIEIEEYTGNTVIFLFEDALGNPYRQLLFYTGGKNLFLQPAHRI